MKKKQRKEQKKRQETAAVEDLLTGKALLASFSCLLREVWQGEEPLAARLTERLTEYEGGKDREKTARKVRNWMHDRNLPKNREEVFRICFALELDEERAEQVLGMTEESGIHYRDPGELIYAFCLRKRVGYVQAVRMKEQLCGEIFPGGIPCEEISGPDARSFQFLNLTGYVRQRFQRVTTEEELRRFLESSRERFGRYHNTAYRKFRRMLDCLIRPESSEGGLPEDQSYSIRKAVEEYLRMGIPYERRLGGYTRVQREIKQHWPSAKSIYEMCARKTDVDRKTLLLLYLATEGENELQTEETRPVEEHHRRMDMMLSECGMPLLNAHCPFDYLVLQAVSGEDEDDFIGLKMERMIRKIFAGREAEICPATEE
ncbi:hypothetical protein B5F07_03225 [Lachnoclostridium sp. An169]|uniref:hypothetical protein n=1 Tax=Lachnoclostridium sp. An169 TaxID=1965569 RepID=UPI000B399DC1|nr:hypothetical protein [Lachnoclostridium sp. An169]OUP85697.1 hypothetical protein B5F07_03225 [Lachnoclostridium sp. An169]HJA67286.1 hypothetical protein [Candidatus Mediterraneibacter cottocaccae]